MPSGIQTRPMPSTVNKLQFSGDNDQFDSGCIVRETRRTGRGVLVLGGVPLRLLRLGEIVSSVNNPYNPVSADRLRDARSGYESQLTWIVLRSIGLAAVICAFLTLTQFLLPTSTGLSFAKFATPTAEINVAVFSLLTAASIAVQLVLRAPRTQTDLPADIEFARREYLSRIAFMLLIGIEAWTFLIVVPLLFQTPEQFPLLTALAVLVWALLLVSICADACVVADPERSQSVATSARRLRLMDLQREYRALTAGTSGATRGSIATQLLVLLLPSILVVVAASYAVDLGMRGVVLVSVVILVEVVGATCAVYQVMRAWHIRDYLGVAFFVLIGFMFALLFTVEIWLGVAESDPRRASFLAAFMVLSLIVQAGYSTVFLGAKKDGTRLLFREILSRTLAKRIAGQFKTRWESEKRPLNNAAIAAFATGLVFPFGFVFGRMAIRQIASSPQAERGATLAKAGIAMSALSGLGFLFLAAWLFWVGTTI